MSKIEDRSYKGLDWTVGHSCLLSANPKRTKPLRSPAPADVQMAATMDPVELGKKTRHLWPVTPAAQRWPQKSST